MLPICLLLILQIAPKVAEVDDHMIGHIVVNLDAPERTAAQISVFNRELEN